MLTVYVPAIEYYDETTSEFRKTKPFELRLEHSLVSMSKWETKWRIPFLRKEGLTLEMLRDYIRCMTLNQNVDPIVYMALPKDTLESIIDYINADLSATTITDRRPTFSREVVTTELIYFWMITYSIPMECQKWHFSRLMKLIRIAGIKNEPPKKMSKNAILRQNSSLNAARRAKLGTKG